MSVGGSELAYFSFAAIVLFLMLHTILLFGFFFMANVFPDCLDHTAQDGVFRAGLTRILLIP